MLGPVPLACLASLLSLLGAVLQWRQERSLRWIVLLAPLAVGIPLLTAYRERAGYLAMGLLLQPFALWLWSTVLIKATGMSPPRRRLARGVFVAGLLPAVWFASCTYGLIGEANERIAKLESLPVPAGAELIEKSGAPWRIFGGEGDIVYRVPVPLDEAKAEVYRRFLAEGWVGNLNGHGHFARDGDCVFVYMWGSPENTYLEMSLVDPDKC